MPKNVKKENKIYKHKYGVFLFTKMAISKDSIEALCKAAENIKNRKA